jgi:hypothetical protein
MHVLYFIFLRKTRILASKKDNRQRTRDGGTEDGKKRSKEQWNRSTEKETLHGTVDRG